MCLSTNYRATVVFLLSTEMSMERDIPTDASNASAASIRGHSSWLILLNFLRVVVGQDLCPPVLKVKLFISVILLQVVEFVLSNSECFHCFASSRLEGEGKGGRMRGLPFMLPVCLAVYQCVIFITFLYYTVLHPLSSNIHLQTRTSRATNLRS